MTVYIVYFTVGRGLVVESFSASSGANPSYSLSWHGPWAQREKSLDGVGRVERDTPINLVTNGAMGGFKVEGRIWN